MEGSPRASCDLQRTEQSRQRLTPRMGVVGHAFEILLIRETHPLETGARRNRFRHRLHDRIGRTVIRAPFGDERIETESHDARRIGVPLPYGNLLHRHLRLGLLRPAAVGHQYRRGAYRGVEHLHHALLRHDIVVRQKRPHLLRDARPRHFAQERIATFDTGHGCLRAVLGSGTVYEFAGEVHDELLPYDTFSSGGYRSHPPHASPLHSPRHSNAPNSSRAASSITTAIRSCDSLMASSVAFRPLYLVGTRSR